VHAIEPPVFNTFGLPHHVVFGWLVMAVLIVAAALLPRRPALVPRGLQNVMEAALEFVLSLIDDVIGPEGRRFLPLIATLGLFIFTSNLLGLVPGFTAPTDNLNTNLACALVVFVSYHWIGIRKHGLGAYLKHFAGPSLGHPVANFLMAMLMVPIEAISHLARPLSLTMRLFGNMLGGHILLSSFFFMTAGLLTWGLSGPAGLLGIGVGSIGSIASIAFTVGFLFPLKILVAFIQAFIFCMLSMLYIAGALEAEHDAEHGHGARGNHGDHAGHGGREALAPAHH
jgi:F-type H+-transporting ATPase subunit a